MSKQAREQKAKEIIKENPKLGVGKINKLLREEFGVGIRSAELLKIKHQETENDLLVKRERQLIRDGFLPSEARQLSINPITTPTMLRYRTERIHTRQELNSLNLAKKQQNQQIKADMVMEGYTIGRGKHARIDALKRFADYGKAISPAEKPAREAVDLTGIKRDIYNKWREAGFTPNEAKELTVGKGGVNVNSIAVFESEAGKRARLDRKMYINDLIKRGWDKGEIRKAIELYYTRLRASVWDFIRKDYIPKGKTSHSNDYIEAVRAKAKDITAKLYRRRR
jgi:hypothetical protein